MKKLALLITLLSLSAPALAAVPAVGLSCKPRKTSSQPKLKALMMNRLIYQNFYNDHGGFNYDSKTNTLTLRTKSGLSTFCMNAKGELGTQVICAPWGEAARVLYRQQTKKPAKGVALLQVLDESFASIGDIFMDCQEL
ncbi:MAG: hypothetical protein ACXWQO_11420 [Bdellovibrionota bacterium]